MASRPTGSPCLRGTGEGTIPSTPLVASRRTRGLWQRKFPVRAKSDHFSVSSALKFIRIPGPIVVESERVRMYTPLAPDGFAFTIASKKARKFSRSFSFPKLALPIPAWSVAVLSTRKSTFPPFRSRTARATSKVTVPDFGFGISPRGPSSFPIRPTPPIMSGVATALSKSSHPPWIFASRSSLPTKSAPASSASFTFSPLANTRTRTLFPVPWGSTTEPRTCWSGYFGSTPSRIATSTVSSNFARAVSFRRSSDSSREYFASLFTLPRASRYFFPCRGISPSLPAPQTAGGDFIVVIRFPSDDVEPHAARRPLDRLDGGGEVFHVEVDHLQLRDLLDLVPGDLAALFLFRGFAPLFETRGLEQQDRRRRSLGDEGERPVREHGDHHGDDHPLLGRRLRVERLAELHDVHAVLPEGGTHGRRRVRLPGHDLQLDLGNDFFRHGFSFSLLPRSVLCFFDLREIELHRSGASEDGDEDDHLPLVGLDAVHDAGEGREGAVGHADVLPLREGDLRLGFQTALDHLGFDVLDVGLGDGGRVLAADEPGDLRGVPHKMPGLLVEIHVDEKVPGEEGAGPGLLLSVFHLHHRLGRDQDVAEAFLHPLRDNPVQQGFPDLLLIPGIGMNDEPLFRHRFLLGVQKLRIDWVIRPRAKSTRPRNATMMRTTTMTTTVDEAVSFRPGQVTFSISVIHAP